MGGGVVVVGGLWDFSVKPQSELDFWILDRFGFNLDWVWGDWNSDKGLTINVL